MSHQGYDYSIQMSNSGCSTPEVEREMAEKNAEILRKAVEIAKILKADAKNEDAFIRSNNQKNKYTKKGTKIALISGILGRAAGLGLVSHIFGKDVVKEAIEMSGGKGKFAALVALAIGVETLIGAGIGKIIDMHKTNQAD